MTPKLKSILLFVLLGIVLPLIGRLSGLLDPRIILLAVASALVFLTQPTPQLEEAKAQAGTDKQSFWWITVMSLLSLHVPLIEWAYFHDLQTQYDWTFPLGAALLVLSIIFRVWAIQTLGRFFTATVQIVDEHQVVQTGPYALVRHPSYTGAYLSYVGTGIMLEAWWGLAFAAVAMGIAYYQRISAEEETLLAHFGEAYEQYSQRTKRLIPFVF
ncbi:MAG: isoprenylcysteine carboxylmethyltransferase family protein [Bacteroidota bacterium]